MDLLWTYDEFLAFTLLYASHADLEYSKEEEQIIKSLVDEKTYFKIHNEFQSMTDYKALETIINYRTAYFNDEESKLKIFNQLRELFKSDGDFSRPEKELLHFLQKLM